MKLGTSCETYLCWSEQSADPRSPPCAGLRGRLSGSSVWDGDSGETDTQRVNTSEHMLGSRAAETVRQLLISQGTQTYLTNIPENSGLK